GLPAIYRGDDRPYAAADGRVVFDELAKHAAPGRTFLDWGSGIGTITIMAERLGFEAVGIEIDARLVAAARELAGRVGSRASFIEGNFVPMAERARLAAARAEQPGRAGGADAEGAPGRAVEGVGLV